MNYVIGIDGGATKSNGLIADAAGKEISRCSGGPANPYVSSLDEVKKTINDLIEELAKQAGVSRKDIKGLCVGLAGIDSPEDGEQVKAVLQDLIPKATVEAVNDSVIALIGGCLKYYGIIVVSGTGSIAYGRNKKGEEFRAGGWGHILGDEGSGYSIALRGLRAVCRAYDGRAPETLLRKLVLKHLNLESPIELMRWTRDIEGGKADISILAPLVFQASQQGDGVAHSIMVEESEELALTAEAVRRRLFSPADKEFEIVVGGSTLLKSPEFFSLFEEKVREFIPGISVIKPKKEPVVGAKMLILRKLGY